MKSIDIREKCLQGITKINEKNPYLTIIGFLVLVFVVDYLLIMQFQMKTLRALASKMTTTRTNLEKSRQDIQRFSAYQNQLKRSRDTFEQVNSKVRAKEDLPLILESISRIANKNGVRLEQVMPNTSLMEPVLKDNDGQYFSVPIQVKARSEYHDFGRFLNQLESEEIFLKISEFVIRSNSNDHTRHDIELTVQAIVFETKEKK